MFPNQNQPTFTVTPSNQLRSTQLYHLKVTEPSSNQSYSFYFRYNTLRSIHEQAQTHSNNYYPPNREFLSKSTKSGRLEYFQNFFETLVSKPINDQITEIGPASASPTSENTFFQRNKPSKICWFLELMGLKSDYPIDLSKIIENSNLDQKFIANPFKFNKRQEEQKSEQKRSFKKKSSLKKKILSKSQIPQDESLNISEISQSISVYENEDSEPSRKANKQELKLLLNGKYFKFFEEKKIGQGGYGAVFLYVLDGVDDDSHKFAVKFIDFNKADDDQKRYLINSILTESHMLRNLDHENIVKGYFYHKFNRNKEPVFSSLMEYCNGGTLEKLISDRNRNKEFLSEEEVIDIFRDIVKGMQYAHYLFKKQGNKHIIHRDLKPDNIFFHVPINGKRIAKIGDFGIAKVYLQDPRVNFDIKNNLINLYR